jgi:transposase InsO family protein
MPATVAQLYAEPPSGGRKKLGRRLVGFARTRELAPGHSQWPSIELGLPHGLSTWNSTKHREQVSPGTWRLILARSAAQPTAGVSVKLMGRIARRMERVTLASPTLRLSTGAHLNLRGTNPWLPGSNHMPEGPWRDREHVELETLNYVDWFNNDRPHESIDDVTPRQAEEVHYAARNRLRPTG